MIIQNIFIDAYSNYINKIKKLLENLPKFIIICIENFIY